MSVKLPLTPDEQMDLLVEAVQPYSELAQEFYVKSILARDFATGMPKLNGDADIVRKGNGFADLELALRVIDDLKKQQQYREDELIVRPGGQDVSKYMARFATRIKLMRAAGLYNLARVVEITAFFIIGEPVRIARGRQLSVAGIKGEIDRFLFGAREAFLGSDSYLAVLANKLGIACKKLIDSSVFSLTLPQRVKELLLSLANKSVDKPVLELWYAQKEALNKRLLDPTRTNH